jgi:hypothetical protein
MKRALEDDIIINNPSKRQKTGKIISNVAVAPLCDPKSRIIQTDEHADTLHYSWNFDFFYNYNIPIDLFGFPFNSYETNNSYKNKNDITTHTYSVSLLLDLFKYCEKEFILKNVIYQLDTITLLSFGSVIMSILKYQKFQHYNVHTFKEKVAEILIEGINFFTKSNIATIYSNFWKSNLSSVLSLLRQLLPEQRIQKIQHTQNPYPYLFKLHFSTINNLDSNGYSKNGVRLQKKTKTVQIPKNIIEFTKIHHMSGEENQKNLLSLLKFGLCICCKNIPLVPTFTNVKDQVTTSSLDRSNELILQPPVRINLDKSNTLPLYCETCSIYTYNNLLQRIDHSAAREYRTIDKQSQILEEYIHQTELQHNLDIFVLSIYKGFAISVRTMEEEKFFIEKRIPRSFKTRFLSCKNYGKNYMFPFIQHFHYSLDEIENMDMITHFQKRIDILKLRIISIICSKMGIIKFDSSTIGELSTSYLKIIEIFESNKMSLKKILDCLVYIKDHEKLIRQIILDNNTCYEMLTIFANHKPGIDFDYLQITSFAPQKDSNNTKLLQSKAKNTSDGRSSVSVKIDKKNFKIPFWSIIHHVIPKMHKDATILMKIILDLTKKP